MFLNLARMQKTCGKPWQRKQIVCSKQMDSVYTRLIDDLVDLAHLITVEVFAHK